MAKKNPIKAVKDFWYGKPHTAEEGGRRLGDLYEDKTGLLKHREWRGVKDTFYYMYNIWGYNYVHMVLDILKFSNNPIDFFKGTWRYRWMGQTYLPVMHWFDRGLEGVRGEALRASAWHYRAMVNQTIDQFMRMFCADQNIGGSKALYDRTIAHDETVWGGVFYPYRDQLDDIPLQMIPYFVTCHVNNHTVLNYIDATQSLGLPGDPCPMCQAECGLMILDDEPDFYPAFLTTNEACDGSVATSVIQDWMINKPLYAMPQPMQFDDPLVQEHCAKEIEGAFRFIEEQMGVEFHWSELVKHVEEQNELQRFEWEKWDVAANTSYYPITGTAQALYRIYQSQRGNRKIWHDTDKRVRKILRHQHGLPDVRHDYPHRYLRQHADGFRPLSRMGAHAQNGRRRSEAHLRTVGEYGEVPLRHGHDVRPAAVQGHAGRPRPVRGRVPRPRYPRDLDAPRAAR